MKPVIVENAIPKQYQDEIQGMVMSNNFPWTTVHEKYADGTCSWSFSYLALNDGPDRAPLSTAMPAANLLMPIAYTMAEKIGKKLTKILRIRIGLLLPSPAIAPSAEDLQFMTPSYGGDEPHIDFWCPQYTGLYYINSSDGDTVIFNETQESDNYTEQVRSRSIRGNICVFDGAHYHASTKPTNTYGRLVVSYNFTAE